MVPGGIHDSRELAEATNTDLVVRRHYAGMDLHAVRFTRLEQDRYRYVSYRVGDQIYWTTHRVHILRGEAIFGDGIHEARVRCGNRLSETPRKPVESTVVPPRDVDQV